MASMNGSLKMKRSEMQLIIWKAGYILRDEYPDELFEEITNTILSAIELAGMSPPPHQERRSTGHSDEYGMEESYDEWVQGWEAE